MKKGLHVDSRRFQLIREPLLVSALTVLISVVLTGSLFISFALAILTGVATRELINQRKDRKNNQLAEVWPEVIDHLVSGLYSGLSITESLAALGDRGPELIKKDFAQFSREMRSGTDFSIALSQIRKNFSHIGSDQIFEALLLAKTLGGGDLINTLRTLGSFMREDLALNKEIAIKHGWIRNSAHISAAAPWLLLLILATQPGTAAAFSSATGVLILGAGLVMTFLAYFWMSYLSKLPITPRVFIGV